LLGATLHGERKLRRGFVISEGDMTEFVLLQLMLFQFMLPGQVVWGEHSCSIHSSAHQT
jgi:hypothetical protein